MSDFEEWLNKRAGKLPTSIELSSNNIVRDLEEFEPLKGNEKYIEIGGEKDNSFAEEYAVSGWFKWKASPIKQEWNFVYRLT